MPIFARRAATLLAALLASAALGSGAGAQTVGTATAVNPTAQGVQGGIVRTLRLGSPVIRNETIRTSAQGSTQILFLDKTTLTVGPSSSVTIDEYVFNPASGTGQASITLGKGIMRFVGGEISHKNRVRISTPVATVGVRGGTVTLSHGPGGSRLIQHYGASEISTPCGGSAIRRPGYAVGVANAGECPPAPQRASKSEIDQALAFLTSGPGQTGGAADTGAGAEIGGVYMDLPDFFPTGLDDRVREAAEQFNRTDDRSPPPTCGSLCNH